MDFMFVLPKAPSPMEMINLGIAIDSISVPKNASSPITALLNFIVGVHKRCFLGNNYADIGVISGD